MDTDEYFSPEKTETGVNEIREERPDPDNTEINMDPETAESDTGCFQKQEGVPFCAAQGNAEAESPDIYAAAGADDAVRREINEYPYQSRFSSAPVGEKNDGSSFENAAQIQSSVFFEKPVKQRKKHGGGNISSGIVVLMIICCLLSGAIGAVLTAALTGGTRTSSVRTGEHEDVTVSVEKEKTDKLMSAAEVYAANVNSTVGITTEITTNYFGWKTSSAAAGSGFIISSDGYIITNYHVIEDSTSVTVTTFSDEKYPADVIGFDETNDIAVLKIDVKGLSPVTLGNSDNLNVGEDVVAIGNPLGELTFSLTKGAVSALNRDVTVSTGYSMKLIQTDCAINSGNSGGALFNMYGEVIGITNAKYSGASSGEASIDNIGFAIPLNSVFSVIKGIIENGTVKKNYTGLNLENLSSVYRFYGISGGALVSSVDYGSPAEKAGIKKGDIILGINGNEISGADAVTTYIASVKPGDTVIFNVYDGSSAFKAELTVEEKEVSALSGGSASSPSSSSGDFGFDDFFSFF